MHGTFFCDFPGFPGFPVLVGTLQFVIVIFPDHTHYYLRGNVLLNWPYESNFLISTKTLVVSTKRSLNEGVLLSTKTLNYN